MLEPFLKWAGGKRWLIHHYADFVPRRFNRYLEPFLGSGAVFFYLLPHKAILSDSNVELIDTYRTLKEAPQKIHKRLKIFQVLHCPSFYYMMRTSVPNDPIKRAARFIYLNRTCFNGLYRVNRQGMFNVPMGSKTSVEFPQGYLSAVSKALCHAVLRVSDFEDIINQAKSDDFLYVDPPYSVMHNTNNFIKYNANLFSWDDQVRLASAIRRATKRGALIMLSNADHRYIRKLYRDFGNHYHLKRLSMLASSSEFRAKTTELLITNYGLRGNKV
jgi:DNA adenine methylase